LAGTVHQTSYIKIESETTIKRSLVQGRLEKNSGRKGYGIAGRKLPCERNMALRMGGSRSWQESKGKDEQIREKKKRV